MQLHLQQVGPESDVQTYQHFAVSVSDFAAAYHALKARGAFEEGTRYADLWLLPSGELQMFARDPSGNLFEIDCPDAPGTLDLSQFSPAPRRLDEDQPQAAEHLAELEKICGKGCEEYQDLASAITRSNKSK